MVKSSPFKFLDEMDEKQKQKNVLINSQQIEKPWKRKY